MSRDHEAVLMLGVLGFAFLVLFLVNPACGIEFLMAIIFAIAGASPLALAGSSACNLRTETPSE